MATFQDLRMIRGDTKKWNMTIRQDTGAAYDLTSATLAFTVKHNLNDANGSAVFTCATGGNGITVTSAANGTIQLVISSAKTKDLSTEKLKLFYDLEVTNSGEIFTVLYGRLTIIPDVTDN